MQLSNLFFVLATTHAMTLCNNTIFENPSDWGAASGSWFSGWVESGLPLPVSPIPPPMNMKNTCVAYAKKKEVCCNDETLTAIATSVTAAKDAIATAVSVLKDEKKFANQIIGLVGPAIKAFCPSGSTPLLPGGICPKLTTTITTYTQRLIDDATNIATDQATCGDALTTYAGGLACMACEVDFAQYIDLENMVINMAENTCDRVYDACVQTISKDVETLFDTVNDFVGALLNDVAGCGDICKNLIPKITLEDMCGGTIKSPGDCRHYVCYEMLDGLASNAWLAFSNILSSIENQDHESRRLTTPKITVSSTKNNEENIELLRRYLLNVPLELENVVRAGSNQQKDQVSEDQVSEDQGDANTILSSASHSNYVSKGYDPYAIGCQDTKTCAGFPFVSLLVIAACVVGVVALAMVVKKRAARRRSEEYDDVKTIGGYGTMP